MQKVVFPLVLVVLVLTSTACRDQSQHPVGDPLSAGTGGAEGQTASGGCKPFTTSQVMKVSSYDVEIMLPEGDVKADLLVLPGWNFSRTDWCAKSSLCKRALKKGYRLILPEMGKSIYASEYYPETRNDWRVYPTRTWVTDTLIPQLQNDHCVLQHGGHNYMVGLSTGARGVALIALHRPGLFAAGAALSGDYDQRLLTSDNLMRGVYGDYESFKDRWEGQDNPTVNADKFTTPLYLGHGLEDDVVPHEQTEVFYKALKRARPDLHVELHLADNKGHDYGYWNSEVDDMITFFDRFQNSTAESVE
jgi:pimeloyl-ACP methyl ester carboxylesterase